jgi:hypothetical protein
MLKDLPYDWHWHIIEGVAALKYDTQWSLVNGGRIDDTLHENGLSNDGTTEYLDLLTRLFPDRVSVYRKEGGNFWEGKVEMCNSFIPDLPDKCLLWQIDVDEFWGLDSISRMRDMFINNPEKMGAFVYCYYFVGPKKFVTTMNTWATMPEDWMRVFRFYKGLRWQRHEPPTLVDKNGVDWARKKVFKRDQTFKEGISFQHFAYSIQPQVYFKEVYYGYEDAVKLWKELQAIPGKVELSHYLPWVNKKTTVDDWNEEYHGRLLFFGDWRL